MSKPPPLRPASWMRACSARPGAPAHVTHCEPSRRRNGGAVMRAGWPSMCAFGLRTVRTLSGGAGYSSQTAPPLAPSCSCGGKEPFRQVGVGRAVVKRSIDGSGPIQQFQFTRLQPAGDRNAMFPKFPPAAVWVPPPGPRTARAAPTAPPTRSIQAPRLVTAFAASFVSPPPSADRPRVERAECAWS
jgi:hypothetical protein